MAADPTYWIECNVGRLVVMRLIRPRTVVDVAKVARALQGTFSALPGKCVICADWRSTSVVSPDVADAFVDLFRRANPHIERSGILVSEHDASSRLQVERAVREAASDARRTFRDGRQMRAWLGEVLDLDERRRMSEFLVDDAV